jgi:hypothetical protein
MQETTQNKDNGIVRMSLRLITWLEQRWFWITLGATTTCGSEGPCAWPQVTGSVHVLYVM